MVEYTWQVGASWEALNHQRLSLRTWWLGFSLLISSMPNSQLLTLLARTPLSEEDKYNVTVIFGALSEERQCQILENWETCAARLIAERERLDREQESELMKALAHVNTLFDEAIAREKEQETAKQKKKRQIREELEATAAYNQMKQMQKIRRIAQSSS